jgi:hypothetical protein
MFLRCSGATLVPSPALPGLCEARIRINRIFAQCLNPPLKKELDEVKLSFTAGVNLISTALPPAKVKGKTRELEVFELVEIG